MWRNACPEYKFTATYYVVCTSSSVPHKLCHFYGCGHHGTLLLMQKKKCPRKKPLRNLFLWTFLAVLIHNSLVSPLAFSPVSHCGDRIMIYGNSTQLHWNKFKKEPVLEFSTIFVSQQIAKNLQKNLKIIQVYKLRKYWKYF